MHDYDLENAGSDIFSQQCSLRPSIDLKVQNARAHIEAYVQQIPAYPDADEGRGVVICAGGRYFPSAWVNIHMLRYLGCGLPIQIWYLSRQEFDPKMQELLRPLGVEFVDASRMRRKFPMRILNGWELKSYAMLHCPFREILFLDADSTPLQNPEFLFSTKEYQETGAIFWPDVIIGDLNSKALIWDICGIPYRQEPAFESGQIVIDKTRCWKELCLSAWFNEYSDFFYNYIYGDKDTFHLAFRKFHRDYAMPQKRALELAKTFVQYDFEGEALFQHLQKWQLKEEDFLDCIFYKQRCVGFLDDLRHQWSGMIQACVMQLPKSIREKQVIKQLINKLFLCLIYGGESRLISFDDNGAIGYGCAPDRIAWDIEENEGSMELLIFSSNSLTYILRDNDGLWSGRKIDEPRNEVHLRFLNYLPEQLI